MIAITKGAIVTHDELKVIGGAAECAVELVEMIIRSETPHASQRTPEERQLLAARKQSVRDYKKLLGKVDRTQKQNAKVRRP